MGRIICRGDIHGDIVKMSFKRYPELRDATEDDVMVFLGDWGVVFGGWNVKEEAYMLNWLNNQKYQSVVVFGNHDDYGWAETLPEEHIFNTTMKKCVHQGIVYDKIHIVDNWCVADICGLHCLLIAHADSHDIFPSTMTKTGKTVLTLPEEDVIRRAWNRQHKFYRILNKSWWPQEKMDIKAFDSWIEENDIMNQEFDCVFSHDGPSYLSSLQAPFRTAQQARFDDLLHTLHFKHWLHGHFHTDMTYFEFDDKMVTCLFKHMMFIGKENVYGADF